MVSIVSHHDEHDIQKHRRLFAKSMSVPRRHLPSSECAGRTMLSAAPQLARLTGGFVLLSGKLRFAATLAHRLSGTVFRQDTHRRR